MKSIRIKWKIKFFIFSCSTQKFRVRIFTYLFIQWMKIDCRIHWIWLTKKYSNCLQSKSIPFILMTLKLTHYSYNVNNFEVRSILATNWNIVELRSRIMIYQKNSSFRDLLKKNSFFLIYCFWGENNNET